MTHRVAIHPAARTDLFDLYDYIAGQSGSARAAEFIERTCGQLADFPERGVPRDDIAVGIRTIALERRIRIAFRIDDDVVVILRVLYAGRSFDTGQIPS